MANSVTASSSMLNLNARHRPITLLSSSSSSSSSSSQTIKLCFSFSHFNSLRQLPCLRTRFPHHPPTRTLTLVEAKKQTFSSFEDLLDNSDKPVLVDFYATWCGPCQLMVSILNEVGETMQDRIKIVKIDTEKYPAIANKYKIQALPTFIVFKDGEPSDRFEGALPADQLVKRIEAALQDKQ